MLKSEVERVVRTVNEETKAEFTEAQIEALSQIILKVTSIQIEEAFANNRGSGGGGGFRR
ncbi:MAG: hypothetical protein JSS86_08315 [Cyanobacteria bacterium SZAS LIN-2]|nr:hypothetical protein [Cyanobacteria bacterium SZAS LIN-2]